MSLQQVRKGSTDILLLSTLKQRKMYGYEIMRELEARSEGYFTMTAALLYPALHRLEKNELVTSEWQQGTGKRKRKYYTLTDKGRQALVESETEWRTFVKNLFGTLQQPAPDLGGGAA